MNVCQYQGDEDSINDRVDENHQKRVQNRKLNGAIEPFLTFVARSFSERESFHQCQKFPEEEYDYVKAVWVR